ncbi:hypothetical protein D9M68_211880 [compost metagenome]
MEHRLVVGGHRQGPLHRVAGGLAVAAVDAQLQVADRLHAVDVHHQVDDVRGLHLAPLLAIGEVLVGDEAGLGEHRLAVAGEGEIDEGAVEDLVGLAAFAEHFFQGAVAHRRRQVLLDLVEDPRLHLFQIGVRGHLDIGADTDAVRDHRVDGEEVLAQSAMGVQHAAHRVEGLGAALLLAPEQRQQVVVGGGRQQHAADGLGGDVQRRAVGARTVLDHADGAGLQGERLAAVQRQVEAGVEAARSGGHAQRIEAGEVAGEVDGAGKEGRVAAVEGQYRALQRAATDLVGQHRFVQRAEQVVDLQFHPHLVQAGQLQRMVGLVRRVLRLVAQRIGQAVGVQRHFGETVVGRLGGVLHGIEPGVAQPFDAQQQAAVVEEGARRAGQHLVGRGEAGEAGRVRLAVRPGHQVDGGEARAIGQVGQRVAEDFQRGDAGIVQVVVGPQQAGQALDVPKPLGAQVAVVERRGQLRLARDGGFSHCRAPR